MTLSVEPLNERSAPRGPNRRPDLQSSGWRGVTSVEVGADQAVAFALIADPRRLNELTPGWFDLQVKSELPFANHAGGIRPMAPGDRVRYRLKLGPVPLVWESEIEHWDAPGRLSYSQRRGPYSWFWHDHILESIPGGTRITDVVEYGVPGGALVHSTVVLPMLTRIFETRQRRLLEMLGRVGQSPLPAG